MRDIVRFSSTDHLDQLTELVNAHISATVPAWVLPPSFLASRLERDPGEYVVDPWVAERTTLVAVERDRVVAAAHLHRYGDDERVNEPFHRVGQIGWLVAFPYACAAARELLAAAMARLADWQVKEVWAAGGLYVPNLSGVPDTWPHVARLLRDGGFVPDPEREEHLYAGRLDTVPEPGDPPLAGLTVRREVSDLATRFAAVLGDDDLATFDVSSDVTHGGAVPALRGWADGWSLDVDGEHRGRGVATWLVTTAVAWLRLGGCDRITFPVAIDDHAAGIDRFYARFGWRSIARMDRAWTIPAAS